MEGYDLTFQQQVEAGLLVALVMFFVGRGYQVLAARKDRLQSRCDLARQAKAASVALQEYRSSLSSAGGAHVAKTPNFADTCLNLQERYLSRDPRSAHLSDLVSSCEDIQRQARLMEARELLLRGLEQIQTGNGVEVDLERETAMIAGYSNCDTALYSLGKEMEEYAASLLPTKVKKPPVYPPGRWTRILRFVRFLPHWYKEVTDSPVPPSIHPPDDDGSF